MIPELIAKLLKDSGYQWNRPNGVTFYPDADDIEQVVEKAIEKIKDEPVGTQIEVGGLIIVKNNVNHDVFVRIGEY